MGNVNSKQQAAIDSLLSGCNHLAAARAARVTPQTLSRWLHETEFVTALARERGRLTNEIGMQIMAGAGMAMATLAQLSAESEEESIRLRASVAILSLATGTLADAEREGRFQLLAAQVDELQRRAA